MMLSSLRYYDELRSNSTVSRLPDQVLDVVVVDGGGGRENDTTASSSSSSSPTQPQQSQDAFAFCHLVALCPFVDTSQASVIMGFEAAYAIALAAQHLNSGDGSVIREVEGLDERCPVRFTVAFEETKLDPGIGLNRVVALTNVQPSPDIRLPSAFLGAFRSAVSVPTSLVTGLRDFPQISGASTSVQLNDKTTHPKFARTIPADNGVTEGIIFYLRDRLKINHVAVLNANDAFGNSYFSGLIETASVHYPELNIIQITIDADVEADEADVRQAIKTLKDSQYRFVVAVLISSSMHDRVMSEAVRQNVAGNGEHNWMFSDASLQFIADRSMSVDSDLFRAYRYSGVFKAAGNQGSRYDAFKQQMRALANSEDIAYMDEMISQAVEELPAYNNSAFLTPIQFDFTAFFYEAAIALGLAACRKVGEDLTLTGDEFYDSILSLPPFESVSGSVEFDQKTGSRVPSSAFFELSNYLWEERVDEETGGKFVKFDAITTDLYNQGVWKEVTPFRFSDGTTMNPRSTPNVEANENLISPSMRAIALSFMVISILVAVAFYTWTNMNRTSRIVRASQPFFLYLIAVGCIIFSFAIIPLQYDTSITDVDGCSKACVSTVWLVNLGFACVYSALYAKTYRINKVMDNAKRYKRIKVTLQSTLIPVALFLSVNVVLLVLMTVFSPPYYDIFVVQVDRFDQPIETYGICVWRDSVGFLLSLVVLNIGIVFGALYEAWKSRFLTTEFAESQHIGRAVIGTLIVVGIGGPILVIARDNPDASLFVSSGIIFVVCILTLSCIFLPKIFYEKDRRKDDPLKKSNVRISGLFDLAPRCSSILSVQQISAAFGDEKKKFKFQRSSVEPKPSFVSEVSQASGVSDDHSQCSDTSETGDRILTTKTQKQLLHDLERLRLKYKHVKLMLQLEQEKNQPVSGNDQYDSHEPLQISVPLKMSGTEFSSHDDSAPSTGHDPKIRRLSLTADVEEPGDAEVELEAKQ